MITILFRSVIPAIVGSTTLLAGCGGVGAPETEDVAGSEVRATADASSETSSARWLVTSPRQCGSNPWEGPQTMTEAPGRLTGEAGHVEAYFRSKGIALEAIGFLERAPSSTPSAVCAACQCPRGDRLVVRVDGGDADRLIRNHDFAPVDNTFGRAAKSCNSNPWDPDRGTRGSASELGAWAVSQEAEVDYVGFVEPVKLEATCRACTCDRGDHAVVIAEGEPTVERLAELGFTALD